MSSSTPSTVLITGANRGIGLQLTKEFLSHQYQVIATSRKESKELTDLQKKYDKQLKVVALEVTDEKSIESALKEITSDEKFKQIDVLLNNAGIGSHSNVAKSTKAEFENVFSTNVIGPLLVTQAVYPILKNSKRKTPVVVNFSSILGSIALNNGDYAPYRAAKAALNSLTKNFAAELQGVTTISLHPGWVQTDMGGKDAPLTVEQSASGIFALVEKLSSADNGKFYVYDGSTLAW